MKNKFIKHKRLAAGILLALSMTGGIIGHAEDSGTSTLVTNVTNINIYKTDEVKGTELGDNARARGTGSIATGKNSLAIGTNAVATGGNESKESIEAKLAENQAKLDEISDLEGKTETLATELTDIRNTYASVIEAGQRVEAAKEAKNNAYKGWQEKLTTYNTAVTDSKAYLEEQQAKIDDLNSRLTGVSQLTNTDISSDEGLTAAANELKAIAEKDTTLNLSTDFYKDYVSSYYAALGDLRQAKITKSSMSYSSDSSSSYSSSSYSSYSSSDSYSSYKPTTGYYDASQITGYYTLKEIDYTQLMGIERDSIINAIKESYSSYSSSSYSYSSSSSSYSSYYYNGTTVTDKPTGDFIRYAAKDTNTQIVSESEYTTAVADKEKAIAAYTKYITDSTDPFFTDELKSELITNFASDTNNYWGKKLDIMYYQGKYEETGDTTWLDKKKQAMNELSSYETVHSYYNLNQHINTYFESWYKENISDVEEKNKITTETLTSELEKALGVSKDAVIQKQKELEALKAEADQAKTNYENINPTQQDEYLASQYAEVMKKLEDKAAELQTSQERLDALKAALTLNDLANVGENTMAVGTNSLATGNNAMAVGTSAIATGENAIAVGNGAIVTGDNSIAIGVGNAVLGDKSGAIGDPNTIYGTESYALGNNNTIGATTYDAAADTTTPDIAYGNNTFVIGNNITTKVNNSVILGNGSADNGTDNIVSVGNEYVQRKIIYVAKGSANTDAANYGQLANSNNEVAYEADENGIVTVTTNDNGVAFKIKMSADTADKANIDASNIGSNLKGEDGVSAATKEAKQDNLNAWGAALGTGAIESGNTQLITGGTMYTELRNITSTNYISADKTTAKNLSDLDTQVKTNETNIAKNASDITAIKNMTNISDEGKTNIKNLAKDAVQVAAGTNIEVTSNDDTEGNRTYTVSAKMGDVAKGDTGLVSGDSVATAIENAVTNNNSETDAKLATKANIDASNIGSNLKSEDGVSAATEEEQQANREAWAKALSGGTVAQGNYQLVTGDTIYNYFKTYEGTASTTELIKEIETRESLIKAGENNTIYIGSGIAGDKIDISNSKGESRVISGVKTDPTDASSVANVGYVNTVYNQMQSGMDSLESRLTGDIKSVGAVSVALAGLKPMAYTPDDKLGFAVATGTYRGTTATAIGAFYQPNEDIMFNLASTIGSDHNAWNAGISFKVGHGSKKAKAKEAASNARIAALEQAVAQLMKQNEELAAKVEKSNQRLSLDLSKKSSFPDVPENHWAKNAIDTLKGNNALHGYPDGKFHGDELMTRYEYAQMLYNALANGQAVDQAEVEKYSPEISEIMQYSF